MADTKKTKRSNSTKIIEMLETTLKIPGRLERSMSREEKTETKTPSEEDDTDSPSALPILTKPKTKQEAPVCQKMISTEGMMKYEDMLTLLKCGLCGELTCPPLVQCRKGHLYCSRCKTEKRLIQCSTCKQTLVDAPNIALDRMVRLIAIPCKYGSRGCQEFVFLDNRLQHETLCKYRPVECQNEKHGCKAVFSMKDMCWHHKMCEFANFPHPNVLPNMPTRKKSTRQHGEPDTNNHNNGGADTKRAATGVVENGVAANNNQQQEEQSNGKKGVEGATQTEIKLFPGVLSMKGT